jgi:hypothetical protein
MIQSSHLDLGLVPQGEVNESSDLEELSDDDLDLSGGCGMRNRSRHGRFGKKRGSHSSFQKHSRSISGQTITKPDGTTITSFSIQEESISSETSEFSDM